MKIALVGAGDVGTYFVEEFSKSSNDVVLLTRKTKSFDKTVQIEQRITDYSVENLTTHLNDCDVVVSTFGGPNDIYVKVHLAILEACRRSPKCKRFIPSEWTVNIEDFPDQPTYHRPLRSEFRAALASQSEVEYTLVCNGWFMDYVVPSSRRYLKDVGKGWPANHDKKVFEMYGDGLQKVSLTSVRDVARTTLALLEVGKWTTYTHFAAQTITYRELFESLRRRDSSWTAETSLFADLLDILTANTSSQDAVYEEHLRIMGFLRVNQIPEDRQLVWGQGAFQRVRPRTVEQFLDQAAQESSTSVL